MESYETINFATYNSTGINERIGGDKVTGVTESDYTTREKISTKPLKFYTDNFFDENKYKELSLETLTRGVFYTNPGLQNQDEINLESSLRTGSRTDKKYQGPLGPLPLATTASFQRGQGDVYVEDSIIRPSNSKTKKTCNPSDIKAYDRTFYIFTKDIPDPMSNVDNIVPFQLENGVSTKGAVTTKKYNRCFNDQYK